MVNEATIDACRLLLGILRAQLCDSTFTALTSLIRVDYLEGLAMIQVLIAGFELNSFYF